MFEVGHTANSRVRKQVPGEHWSRSATGFEVILLSIHLTFSDLASGQDAPFGSEWLRAHGFLEDFDRI